jgi:hypothetical protein
MAHRPGPAPRITLLLPVLCLACQPPGEPAPEPAAQAAALRAGPRAAPAWSPGPFLERDARRVHRAPTGEGFVAHQPGLRLTATARAFRLEPATPSSTWSLALSLERLASGGLEQRLPPAELAAEAARLRWVYPGLVVQELENGSEAFQQTLHVLAPQGARFALGFRLEGAAWELVAGGLRVTHLGRDVLQASPPRAFEPDGRELPCRFARRAGRLWIEVEDARRYPVTVDPAWTSSGQDRELARFGWAMAGVGDVNGDGFGDVLVTAPYFSTANTGAGKAYLFYGQADGLAASPAWSSSGDDRTRAHFGLSAAPAGDLNRDGYADFAVGAPDEDGTQTDAGRAFVFMGSRNGPSVSAAWASSGFDEAQAYFGTSLASAGDVNGDTYPDLVVGAPAQSMEIGPTTGSGMAYVYLGTAQGLSTTHAWTQRGDDAAGAGFGFSVAGAGDVNGDGFDDLVVGAYLQTFTYQTSGRAFLFLGSAGGPAATAAWSASGDAQAYAQFGFSVAGAGDMDGDGFDDVAVGAPGHDTAQVNAGRAYVYRGGAPGTGLTTAYWWRYAGTDRAQARYGWSVAGAGDVNADGKADLLVGAPGEDTLGTAVGRAFLYSGALSGPLTPPTWASSGEEQAEASFGSCVASAGDVNADGAADLLVSAPYQDIPGQDAGRAFLYLGVKDGPGLCEPQGTACDDLDPCTYPDLCDAAGACRGAPFTCDDQNPCTTDECRTDGTCGHLHNSDPCDDHDACTEGDTCSATQCLGTPRDCSWLDGACSQGGCEAASGTCQALPRLDGTPCDDGDACTGGDACRGGTCVPVQDLCAEGGSGCASAGGAGGGLALCLLLLGMAGVRGGRLSRARRHGSACSRGRRASGEPRPRA